MEKYGAADRISIHAATRAGRNSPLPMLLRSLTTFVYRISREPPVMATSLTGARRLGPLLKRTKELEPLLDDELRSFFGNEMSASLDLTALNVVGNVLPGRRDVAQKRLSAPG